MQPVRIRKFREGGEAEVFRPAEGFEYSKDRPVDPKEAIGRTFLPSPPAARSAGARRGAGEVRVGALADLRLLRVHHPQTNPHPFSPELSRGGGQPTTIAMAPSRKPTPV